MQRNKLVSKEVFKFNKTTNILLGINWGGTFEDVRKKLGEPYDSGNYEGNYALDKEL